MRVAWFNLNNLFSRFDSSAEVDSLPAAGPAPVKITTEIDPSDPGHAKFRTFKGRLVKGKSAVDRAKLATRIAAMDADVLAVQEVEDVTTLTAFASNDLIGLAPHWRALLPGARLLAGRGRARAPSVTPRRSCPRRAPRASTARRRPADCRTRRSRWRSIAPAPAADCGAVRWRRIRARSR